MMEKIEYKGHTINISQDTDPMNPRTEWDNLGTMACFHSRYSLGDTDHGLSIEDAKRIDASDDYVSLPLYLYDHSGITMNTTGFSCPWDSGKVGIIFVSKKKIREEYSVKRVSRKLKQKIEGYLIGEVKTYDDFLTGNVYGYEIDEDGDSCWGFFGDNHEESGLMEYAKNSIDCL
jgi:hypothetical protein